MGAAESHIEHDWDVSFDSGERAEAAFKIKHPGLIHKPRGVMLEDFSIGHGGPRLELKAEQRLMDTYKNRGKSKLTRNIAVEIMSRKRVGMVPYVSGVGQAIQNDCQYFVSWFQKDDVEFWYPPLALWKRAIDECKRGVYLKQWIRNTRPRPDSYCVFIPYDMLRDIQLPSPLEVANE